MNRRHFLKNTSASVAGLSTLSILYACATGDDKTVEETGTPSGDSAKLFEEITIDELQKKMEDGRISSRTLTEWYLNRIRSIDKDGPKLNSVIEVNPDALAIADAMDAERKNKKVRGPLHGIPVLIKDNIETADKMMTTAGSLALEGNIAKNDAFIIQQLRDAGAVLLGKTNLSEWANFRSTRSSSGWSSRGGQTRNPYILDRSPCGSSSGSGTAVAANLCTVAIGTETDGSIACPSSINGVVGIKPTVGLWSRTGIIPISHTQDTAGPMARTVKDAVLLLGALTATDPSDKASAEAKGKPLTDYTAFLKKDGLKGKKIGIEKSFLKVHEAIDSLLAKAVEQMKANGAEIIEVDLISKVNPVRGSEFDVLQWEFKEGLNKYLSSANGKVKSLEELIEYNSKNEAQVMPFFKQEILIASQEKSELSSTEYKTAQKKLQDTTRKAILDVINEHGLTAICGPANGPSWCIDLVNGDFFTGYGMYSPAAIAGYPSVTVPMGMVNELPIGLSFIGNAFSEGALIEVAYSYEQVSLNRIAPAFIPTINGKEPDKKG